MKLMRIIAFLLAILTLGVTAVACVDNGGEDTTDASTTVAADVDTTLEGYDKDGYKLDNLPESIDFDETITIYMWDDWTMLEFYSEETGDQIADYIYERNVKLEERLGVELEFVEEAGSGDHYQEWIKKAANDYQSSNDYDIFAGYSRSAPNMALEGMTADLNQTEYFDSTMPWWPKALISECEINDKLLFCSGDISTNLLWMMIATFYNKDLYEEHFQGQKTPEEMVKDNEWTMETMFNMTKDVWVDVDGDTNRSDGDKYGYVIYTVNVDAFQTAAGVVSVVKNSDGGIEISSDFKGERTANVCELVGNFLASNGCYGKNSTGIRNIFFEERGIFIMDRVFIVAGKDRVNTDRIEFDYGIVPNPKYTVSQENFMTNVGHPFTMYAVSSGIGDDKIDISAAVLECMGSINHRTTTPAVFEVAMKVRYTDDPEAADMYDIIRNNISFDLGRLYATSFSNYTANVFRTTALSANPSGYSTTVKRYDNIFKKGITEIMEAFE